MSKSREKKRKNFKKILNKTWAYGTIAAIIMVIVTGLILAIGTAYRNKQQLVLNALAQYNSTVLGYQKPETSQSRTLAFEKSVKMSIKDNSTLMNSIEDDCTSVELLEYFNNALMRIENYSADINSLIERLENANIDAWIISTNSGETYYGNKSDGTQMAGSVQMFNSSAITLDDFMAEIKSLLKNKQTILVNSETFGVYYLTASICENYCEVEDQLEDVDKLLVIIRILKCGYPTSELDTVLDYYDTIKNS
jgi:hypothetical protein